MGGIDRGSQKFENRGLRRNKKLHSYDLILKILNDTAEPLGARVLARHLKDHGVDLAERSVRYHLKLMDERGLTQLVGNDGRLITREGIEELKSAL